MGILNALGLMTRADFDRERLKSDGLRRDIVAEREKFKTAISDLAAARDEIAALRPDAKKFRAKAARDAEIKRAKRAAAKKATGKG